MEMSLLFANSSLICVQHLPCVAVSSYLCRPGLHAELLLEKYRPGRLAPLPTSVLLQSACRPRLGFRGLARCSTTSKRLLIAMIQFTYLSGAVPIKTHGGSDVLTSPWLAVSVSARLIVLQCQVLLSTNTHVQFIAMVIPLFGQNTIYAIFLWHRRSLCTGCKEGPGEQFTSEGNAVLPFLLYHLSQQMRNFEASYCALEYVLILHFKTLHCLNRRYSQFWNILSLFREKELCSHDTTSWKGCKQTWRSPDKSGLFSLTGLCQIKPKYVFKSYLVEWQASLEPGILFVSLLFSPPNFPLFLCYIGNCLSMCENWCRMQSCCSDRVLENETRGSYSLGLVKFWGSCKTLSATSST